jgi:hypothetical protein
MTKTILLFGAGAAALIGATADARQYSNTIACSGWRDGQCVAWNRLTKGQAHDVAVGTVFGPNYTYYSPYSSIPQTVVTQYHLSPDYKYVSADGYVYVVDPHSYAVTQVIAPSL